MTTRAVIEPRLRPRRVADRGASLAAPRPSRTHPARATTRSSVKQRRSLGPGTARSVALLDGRLVGRRGTADGGRDVDVGQGQAVVGRRDDGRSASPARWSAAHRKSPERVAGEDPAGPVAAVGRRSQPDDQDPRLRVAEPGHRSAPVRLVAEAARPSRVPRVPAIRRAADSAGRSRSPRSGPRARPGPSGHLSRSLSIRRDTTNSPTKPMIARYATWTSSSGEMRPDGQRPDEVDALVQRRQLDDEADRRRVGRRSGRTCRRTGTSAGRRAGSGRSPATSS